MKDKKEWYLGLDIGTSSVGFSATDTEYNILTKSGMLQCGARLFSEAQSAKTRRGFRSSRRRIARRKVRIDLLQELFSEVITRKDPVFFIRLNDSSKHIEDKVHKDKYPLFNDSNFTDKEHYKRFPTIYHLRKHLLENDTTDPRLLYLVCHHIIKYRGHFLFPTFNTQRSGDTYKEIILTINEQIGELIDDTLAFDLPDDIISIINDKSKSPAKQWFDIKEKMNPTNNKKLNAIFTIMQGNKITLSKIWSDVDEAEKEAKEELREFKFSSEKYEECLAVAETILNDDQLGFLAQLKTFYDLVRLDRVMMGAGSISEAMVARYNEHKADLKLLKTFIKKFLPDEYNKMFRLNTDYKERGFAHASYVNYIGTNLHNKKTVSHFVMCIKKGEEPMTADYESFLKYTDDVLEKASENAKATEEYKLLKEKIENKTLCKIHNTQDNSVIPHQINETELQDILERQKYNFPFLQNSDEDGCVANKIISLLTFRIPYYVGPLSEKDKGKFAWIEKNKGYEKTQVLPWNFAKVVDTATSGERFITRMTAKCTYLKSEDVIPQQSLLYQKYMLLQDLNNLKINGDRISQEVKLFLFNGVCQKKTSLSKKVIKDTLLMTGKIDKTDTVGKETENDTAFNSSLSSLIKFKAILGDNVDITMCEDIIKWHTVFGDEKAPVLHKIKGCYGDKLTEEQIAKLGKLNFKGWGRFSRKFLDGITTTDKSIGETALTIIKVLENTTLNLMEVLNSDNFHPKYLDIVAMENSGGGDVKVDYSLVEGLYCSPLVKRSIWQAVLISKELAKINGSKPKKVFLEVTRGEDKKQKGKMKSSRRKQIEELFTKAVKAGEDLTTLLKEFNNKADEKEFRSDRLYFYFTQLGKCMYSGERINLEELNNVNLYDIDHIYPQSKIKDDSLTNRVLVKRIDNANKSATYPVDQNIQIKMKPFWDMILSKELISKEKHNRLTCKQPLSEEIISGFLNRQLVTTNQAVKESASALKQLFGEDTKVVYSKASLVSEFRHNNELVKCREVNNLHHAHDAYLNIVVGNVWDSIFGQYWNTNITFNEENALDRLFTKNREGIWQEKYIQKIKEYLYNNKNYLGKYPVTYRPFEKKGEFYDQTIHPKGRGQYELHKGYSTQKYGGYKNAINACNCVIEYDGKTGRRIRGIFPVPIRFVGRYVNEELALAIAQEHNIADKNPFLILPKIQMFSVLEIDGVRYHMRSGDLQCSVTTEWYPNQEIINIIHDIVKYQKLLKDKELTADLNTMEDITFATRERNKHQKESKKITRENNLKVFDAIIEQVKKPFYVNYSFAKKVKDGKIDRLKFKELKTYEQIEQLLSLLNLITMNGTISNASKIGGVTNEHTKYMAGSITKDISSHRICLITQSVTGLFEKKIDLNS